MVTFKRIAVNPPRNKAATVTVEKVVVTENFETTDNEQAAITITNNSAVAETIAVEGTA